MSGRGWEKLTPADAERMQRRGQRASELVTPMRGSKYRNVKTVIDGHKFDSQKEARIWSELRLREKAGEISDLSRQYALDLCCPSPTHPDESLVVARYIADFRYLDLKAASYIETAAEWVYVDAKGGRNTQMFQLKKRWLELQYGIRIIEVR